LKIADVKADFTINNFQIVNETIVELDEDTNAVSDALNTMSPLLATKVLESMTINEIRAMASLPPVQGGDVTRDQQAQQATQTPTL
jgi:hypothetical protein